MPYLSLVVPCFRVQAYLRQCLDSILGQSFRDFEVIAVDDASPDHSGEILDEYASRDPRLTVIHLEENVGLGEARNVATERATGEYVLFIDSDDWLADGALLAISDRLREAKPDILFFDYVRSFGWGRGQRTTVAPEPTPTVFSLRDRPNLMNRMSSAWNKAYRREFLIELGLRFPAGYYEDWPVHYPVLMAATRISLLDRVCYYYRQREGAITKTQSRKHFDAFEQCRRVFEFMDHGAPELEEFRAEMFRRMIYHYLIILTRRDRLRHEDRKEFFERATADYKQHVPQGFQPPKGREGLKYRLIARGAYPTFEMLRAWSAALAPLRDLSRKLTGRSRSLRRRVGRQARLGQYRSYLRRPVDPNLAAYASYWYRAPACNPLAIYRKMRQLAPEIHGVWIVQADQAGLVPEGIPYVVEGTREYYRLLARAKYLVNNVNFPNFVVKREGTIHLQTQHGTPLKTMGVDLQRYPVAAKGMGFRQLVERADRWDYNLSSNRHSSEVWERVFPVPFEMLEYGYPRNDRFYTADEDEILRIRAELGIEPGRTAILYAPTHRDYRDDYELDLDLARVVSELPADQVMLVRAHYFYDDHDDLQALARDGLVIDVSKHPSVEDLCLAADVLLSDYSSIMFDYANLARPIVLFADDFDTYQRVRGLYIDILGSAPGEVALDEDALVDILVSRRFESPESAKRLAAFRRRFCEWDDGNAAERVVRRIFLGEEPKPSTPLDERVPAPAPRDLVPRARTSAG